MNHSSKAYIHNDGTIVHYDLYGSGDSTLICFHGFGQRAKVFNPLALQLNNFRIISIDLFFHGESQRKSDRKYLKHKEWQSIFKGLLTQESVLRFSLLGYSMGGRYTISCLLSFQDRIDRVILIAPDGIIKRFWFEFATMPIGPAQLFSQFMHNPKPFFRFLSFLERTKLMNATTLKFARSQLKNDTQRLQVLNCWIMLRYLEIAPSQLSKLLDLTPKQSLVIFGANDKVIDHKQHQKFFRLLHQSRVKIINARHHDMVDQSIGLLVSELNKEA